MANNATIEGPRHRFPRLIVIGYFVGAAVMVPWTIYLGISLPHRDLSRHYDLTWTGFDVFLVIVLFRVGWLALQGRRQVEIPAAILANLLLMDAWFDITSANSSQQLTLAVTLAVLVEIPTALLSLSLIWRVERTERDGLVIERRDPEPVEGQTPDDAVPRR